MSERKEFSKKVRIVVSFDGQKLLETHFHQGPVTFGRQPTNDVHLDYPFISRAHCQVVEENGRFFLKDLGSRNGIKINDIVQPSFSIDDNISLRLDKLVVEVILEEKALQKPGATVSIQNAETVIAKLPSASQVPGNKKSPLQPKSTAVPVTPPKSGSPAASTAAPAGASRAPIPDSHTFHAITHSGMHRNHIHGAPLVDRNFTPELIEYHPGLKSAAQKKLEAIVFWQDQVYEVREFDPNEKVTVGSSNFAALNIPVIPKGWALAKVDFQNTQCFVPKDKNFSVIRDGQAMTAQELINNQQAKPKGHGFTFKMGQHDIVNVDVGGGMKVFLRYVPATKSLTKKKLTEPDYAIKQAMLGSAILHGIFSLLMIIFAPATTSNVPKLKNVPERYARLLVEPPKPIIPLPEPPPPPTTTLPPVVKKEPPKPVKKPEPRKVVEKVKPKKMELPKKLEKQNKFPMVVKNPQPKQPAAPVNNPVPNPPKEPPPVKVESLGALAALGPISDNPSPSPAMNNIKIDKNAGGLASKTPNTSGMMNALPSSSGKLAMVGNGSVKTGGKGIGSGTAYGTQGLSGGAGTRAVGGGVVGQPKLATSSGKTEGLTRAQVMAEVQKHLAAVQACYEKSLLSNANLAGRMEFEWDIEPSGSVSAVRIKRSTVNGGDALGSCVKGVFSAMQFPAAKNGASTTPNIGFPFGRL